MKKGIVLGIFVMILLFVGCSKDKEENIQKKNTEKMLGTWKVKEIDLTYSLSRVEKDESNGIYFALGTSSNAQFCMGNFNEDIYSIYEEYIDGAVMYIFENVGQYIEALLIIYDVDGNVQDTGTLNFSFSNNRDIGKLMKKNKDEILEIVKKLPKPEESRVNEFENKYHMFLSK